MFAIAKTLGGMTADELAERLTVQEFYEWAAVFKLEREATEEQTRKASARAKRR